MSLRDQLQTIYDQRGQLTPNIVVDEARDPGHPLHNRFEWDNSVAGEAWRRQQAHELIRSVRIVYREATEKEPARKVRHWHAVRNENGHVYEPAPKVAADPLLRQMVLRDMEREWRQLQNRYGQFQEFIEMVRRSLGEEAA